MSNYYVIEIQTNADGTSGCLPYGYENKADAEEKFGLVFAAAAKSSVMIHTVMLVTSRGVNVRPAAVFTHPAPSPEPTPEQEQAPNE